MVKHVQAQGTPTFQVQGLICGVTLESEDKYVREQPALCRHGASVGVGLEGWGSPMLSGQQEICALPQDKSSVLTG
jgi:hypothetical protein